MKRIASYFLFLVFTTSFGQNPALPPDVIDNISQRIEKGINPGIAIGIVDAEGVQYYNFGVTADQGDPIDEHSVFEIGSISKTFTAILLADMALQGKLSIDDPAGKFLPGSVTMPTRNGAQITLAHLSDHTSSIPRMPNNMTPADPANPYADYTVEQMYAFISSLQLTRDIGSEYEYSNLAQGLLGHILALQAGMSYEQLMRTTIAEPLGMSETRIQFTDAMRRKLALPHADGFVVSNWDIPTLAGAGAIRSTVHDMVKYLAANLGYQESPLAEAMQLTHQSRHHKGGSRVGLGWHIVEGAEGDVITHSGGTGGYRAFAGFVKETGRGVVVLTNSSADIDEIGYHLLSSSAKLSPVKVPAAREIRRYIDSNGHAGLAEHYQMLKTLDAGQYIFSEDEMNSLGYYYLGANNVDAALAVFKINTDEYPNSFNVWDSYAEAWMTKGDNEAAILHYRKSLELNPGNMNGIAMLAKLGVTYTPPEVMVSEEILETYVGNYQLMPGFSIVITREATQLYGQGTGQGRFEMFPSSETEFYLKVVPAQIKFNKNEDGTVKSLTLYQGGQVLEGVKG